MGRRRSGRGGPPAGGARVVAGVASAAPVPVVAALVATLPLVIIARRPLVSVALAITILSVSVLAIPEEEHYHSLPTIDHSCGH